MDPALKFGGDDIRVHCVCFATMLILLYKKQYRDLKSFQIGMVFDKYIKPIWKYLNHRTPNDIPNPKLNPNICREDTITLTSVMEDLLDEVTKALCIPK